jgi:FlaA1/EpsC-like NDP-sugar epimerase
MIGLRKNTPRWIIFMMDIVIALISLGLSYFIRFDAINIPLDEELDIFLQALPVFIIVKGLVLFLFKIHNGLVRFTGLRDAKRIFFSSLVASLIFIILSIIRYVFIDQSFLLPTGVIAAEFLTSIFLMISVRFAVKLWYLESMKSTKKVEKVFIYGAGDSGQITKRTLERDPSRSIDFVGFIDDNKKLSGKRIEGIEVYHSSSINGLLSKDVDSIIISIQNPIIENKRKLIDAALVHSIDVLEVPSVDTWINGELSAKQLKKVRIENLLGRKPIQLDDSVLSESIDGKVVLITGAAGSIGAGLSRLICSFSPKKILLLDQAESPLYDLMIELRSKGLDANIEEIIGDIRSKERMRNVFSTFKPDVVFHAAAYKHVPLMEDNPTEAIRTNVKGTKNLVDLADEFSIEKFVMVSTDKAVNPTNVMGASKRIAEIYAQSINESSKTKFVTTRFGNVLGSNGSVIPLFRRQIEEGGPLTVTHEDVTRYFMTIPEACRLVLEAGSMGGGGEIYVFDMGEPVRIVDLAKKMISLSGLELEKDIKIKITGLRPGEKLYEELLATDELTKPTHHPQILIADVKMNDIENVKLSIVELIRLFESQDNIDVVAKMKEIVPEFISNNSIYTKLDKS